MRSVTVSKRSRSLETMMTVELAARCSLRSKSNIFCDVTGSSPAAGSSYKTMDAWLTVARATPTLFFWPPERPEGNALLEVGEGDAGESFGHARRDFVVAQRKEAPERERDVVGYTEMIEERIVLKEHPEFQTHRLKPQLGHLRDVFAFDQDFAAIGAQKADDEFQEHALSGGARPIRP